MFQNLSVAHVWNVFIFKPHAILRSLNGMSGLNNYLKKYFVETHLTFYQSSEPLSPAA